MIDGSSADRDVNATAQVCVVGSGAGGAVVAKELAQAGIDVVLVEEGGHFTGKDFTGDPKDMLALLYRNRGLTGAVGRVAIPIPLGKCVGGTTVVNSGTRHRPPGSVLDGWRSEHGVEIDASIMAPMFERVEREINVQPVVDEVYGNNSRLFEAGAIALGFAGARIPRNTRGCMGTGVCALGCPQDAKQAMHVSYVPRAEAAGARVYTRCRVERVLTGGGRAYGVVGSFVDRHDRDTGQQLRVLADRVVLACGALLTPALLDRSGIDDPSGYRGRNLHIHPAARVSALFREPVNGWQEVPQAYNIHQFIEEGIFIQGQFVPPALAAPALPGVAREHRDRMRDYARLGSFGALISDVSEGRVRATKGKWPLVTYRMMAADVAKLTRAISLTARVFFAAGAQEVYSAVFPRPVLRSEEAARQLESERLRPADIEMMAFHPQGTCRMGNDPKRAVTDSFGECYGTRHLYVGDASLFPSSTKVNPQVTIMAMATRIAERIADDLR